jgi:hypothetical protein
MSFGARVREGARHKVVWGFAIRVLGVILAATALPACGELTRQGTSSSYLIITALDAASGADPNEFRGTLLSDVVTIVDDEPSIFNDFGRVSFLLALKDPGTSASALEPTQNNLITVDRYRVRYVRADGRNTPGVDVPYPFDGALTVTVGSTQVIASFEIVRHIAKEEAPLGALARNPTVIHTIAEVTFFGHDQTGREVSVMGRIGVDFGNFADPDSDS